MKKFISLMISLMCVLSLVACGGTDAKTETTSELVTAKDYLYAMYKDKATVTPKDYEVVSVVNIGGVVYDITWTADSDTIKIGPSEENPKMTEIDVYERNPEELSYTLTATLADTEGNTESVSFERSVPRAKTYEEIVEDAYKVEAGKTLGGEYRLFGTITTINDAYSEQYGNITVTIQIGEMADKPIMCYRLKGDGVATLAEGDQITVEGVLKNYNGTIEFDQGCVLLGIGEVLE